MLVCLHGQTPALGRAVSSPFGTCTLFFSLEELDLVDCANLSAVRVLLVED